MLKNRFILSVLAACSCSALVQAASPFTYSYEDHPGSGLKDVTVTLEASWGGVLSPTGYSPDTGNRVPAAYEEVHDSEVNVVEGASSSYIVSAEAHNEGIVRGKRTINMDGGHVWGLIGGHVYYKDILESFTPYNSKEDVVINLRGGSATRVNGGGLFSVEKIIKEDGTKVVCSSGEYVALKGGTAALAVGGDVYINVTGSGEVKEEMFGGGSYGSVVRSPLSSMMMPSLVQTIPMCTTVVFSVAQSAALMWEALRLSSKATLISTVEFTVAVLSLPAEPLP